METTSPTVWRRWLAREMTSMRLAAGLGQSDVARALRSSVAKVSYAESGRRAFKRADLEKVLLPLLNVPEDRWRDYLDACDRSRRQGWWDRYDDEDVVPNWFRYYLGLEDGAETMRGCAVLLVPGLFQTRDYTREIMEYDTPEDASDKLEIRGRRQQLLDRQPNPLVVHYVLDEAVLRRRIGTAAVMREQVEHLIELAERPNITIQLLPFESGYYFDGAAEPAILDFPWDDDLGVVQVHGHGADGRVIEDPATIADYEAAFDRIQRLALPPVESLSMLRRIADDHQPQDHDR